MIELSGLSCKCRLIALAGLAALCGPMLLIHPAAAASEVESADHLAYVLLPAGSQNSYMSGSLKDLHRAQSLRAAGEGLLYARRGGSAYVIRDAATLRQAESIFEPQHALSAQQAELGSRQAALGRRQAQLGAQQARLGTKGHEQLQRQQEELGRQQQALGRQQSALGREQSRLGRLVDARLRALFDDAMERGVAQRVE